MCTSIAWRNGALYFGRNLDLETDFGQQIVVMPRKAEMSFRNGKRIAQHYAMMGMATVMEGQPLFAEAVNEKGLCIAGLNFPGFASYAEAPAPGKTGVAPFELPWWLLGQCATLEEAKKLLLSTDVLHIAFLSSVPVTPLHWHVADRTGSVVVECCSNGMHIHENPYGVLTNSPPFDFHVQNLAQYMQLTSGKAENNLLPENEIVPFGNGLGSFGLPGDPSPASRFVRAAFLIGNACCDKTEEASVAQFFHTLDNLGMVKGSVQMGDRWEYTLYSCCINADRGLYYVKSYGNNRLSVVDMHREALEGRELACYALPQKQDAAWMN